MSRSERRGTVRGTSQQPPSTSARRSRGRRLRALTVAVVALGVVGASAAPGQTTVTPAQDGRPTAAPADRTDPHGKLRDLSQPREVTLLTGDTVSYAKTGDSYDVRVVEPRPVVTGAIPPAYATQAGPDGVYVIPSDAWPLIQAGRLDRELFNVSYLVDNGYANTDTTQLPVIVQYPARYDTRTVRSKAQELDHIRLTASLSSISSAAVDISKASAEELWNEIVADEGRDSARAGFTHGISKVWLDRKAALVLDESVPLVGAPKAWAAGYDGAGVTVAVLDSGIDQAHPDVADQVTAIRSFVDGPATDGFGHGTHVASTIAGTGKASDGRYTGVAPAARLAIGKVCLDSGSCPASAVIEGMEWAAEQEHASVVSLSLGGCCSDGTDPMAQAVNSLTASTGALFVIAAGNDGPSAETVGTPGVADAALAVAATSKSDGLADFSSRGPRIIDGALKPEIAAPGVDIAAARASGTSMGNPVDDFYTSASGTSMATPHVSGAAAILAQKFPDWDAAQLKAALMSTSVDVHRNVYEVGAGRLDIGRAISQPVFATTASIDLGIQELPADGQPAPDPVTKAVTYANVADGPVTLRLDGTLTRHDGTSADGAVSTDDTVTVPAHGSATVDVSVGIGALERGRYSGALTAEDSAAGVRLTTPIGLVLEARKYTLTVRTIGVDGTPVTPSGQDTIDVTGPDGRVDGTALVDTGVTRTRVSAGTYSVAQFLQWVDDSSRLNRVLLTDPQIAVAGDTEVTLDARAASQVSYDTPRPGSPVNADAVMGYQRTTSGDVGYASAILPSPTQGAWTRLWASPTADVTKGGFRFWTQQLLGVPEVTFSTVRPRRHQLDVVAPMHDQAVVLDPVGTRELVQDTHPDWVPFTGTHDLRLVDVGRGTSADLNGVDLRGRLALLEADASFTNPFGGLICGLDILALQRIRDAGAAGIAAFPARDHPCGPLPIPLPVVQQPFTGSAKPIGIANAHLPTSVGLDLRRQLAAGPVTIRVVGTPESPYSYVLKTYEEGGIPTSLRYRLTNRNLATARLDYQAPRETTFYNSRTIFKRDDVLKVPVMPNGAAPQFTGPTETTEYVGPTAADVFQFRSGSARQGGLAAEGATHPAFRTSQVQQFVPGSGRSQPWYGTPLAPGVDPGADFIRVRGETAGRSALGRCDLCRQGGYLFGYFPMVTGGVNNHQTGGSGVDEGYDDLDIHLYRGEQEVAPLNVLNRPVFILPDGSADYRLTVTGPQTDASWTFTSAKPTVDTRRSGYQCLPEEFGLSTEPCAPLPMVFASYDLADTLRSYNTVRTTHRHRFDVFVYHGEATARWPAIAGLRVWTRVGDSGHWVPATTRRTERDSAGNSTYQVTASYPGLGPAGASVDLRVETWDGDGNTLTQTTKEAFRLGR